MLLPLFECVHKSNIFTATDTTHPYEGDRWSNLLKKKNTDFCQKNEKRKKSEQTKIFSVLPLSTRRPRIGAKRFFSSRLVNRQSIDQFIASVLRRVHESKAGSAIVKLSSGWTWSLRVQRLDSFSFSSFVKVSWFSIENNAMMMMRMKRRLIGFLWQLFKLRSSFLHSLFLCHLHQILPGGNTLFGLRWKYFLSNNNNFFLSPKKSNWLIQLLMRELWQTPPPSSFDYATFQNLRSSPSRNTTRNKAAITNIPFFNFWFYHLWKI